MKKKTLLAFVSHERIQLFPLSILEAYKYTSESRRQLVLCGNVFADAPAKEAFLTLMKQTLPILMAKTAASMICNIRMHVLSRNLYRNQSV